MSAKEIDVFGIQRLVEEAGEIIREYYRSQKFTTDLKKDRSPLTDADRASNELLMSGLERLFPKIPVISEESDLPDYRLRAGWDKVWIVDPLDGTEEFIERNGRFCVNVALIEKKKPVFGMISVLNDEEILWGMVDKGCFICKGEQAELVRPSTREGKRLRVAVSRLHVTEKEFQYIDHLQARGYEVEIVPLGASSKYCMVAKGEIDLAPKFGRCSEWDVAAGQALVEAAGGLAVSVEAGKTMTYNNPSMSMPAFIMFGKRVHEMIRDGNTDFQWSITR
ncbi:MAG: 3'(2'),5'-bisphosphate nucleotidase CysQ [Odoribacteraceae bacterium]|jgi:3'(2'), 5'-bisphosphate nucleotidase|nr:3'(2'),5'-bisphosphate nucleotidase CysQ [Odoribacteraceae bacterium]